MNVSGLRRNIKNIAHNYTDAQVKVREATSNDPWGPSSSLMSEIADLTYNVVAFTEIMQMIWKRLNDHGKNWRHVYKALVLLDYLVKTGNEKVAQQCKENIFAIHTLKDFQHYEDGKDQGIHVREKSKQLAALLKDDERLKNERAKALKARERFAQQITGFGTGSDPSIAGFRSDSFGSEHERMAQAAPSADLDLARPQTAGEEELQLQLALAISREEAEKEEEKRRSDEVRLALAISQSQESGGSSKRTGEKPQQQQQQQSHLLDLLDVNVAGASGWVDPWGTPAHPSEPPAPVMPPRPKASAGFPSTGTQQQTVDPWGAPVPAASALQSDPWGSPAAAPRPAATPSSSGLLSNDPWAPKAGPAAAVAATPDPWSPQPPVRTAASASADPWSPVAADQKQQSPSNGDLDDFDLLVNRKTTTSPFGRETNGASSPFDTSAMRNALEPSSSTGAIPKKSPENFLGANSNLVNLDNLVAPKPAPVPAANPFALTSGQPNPFQQAPAPKPSINELRHQQNFGFVGTPLQQQAVPAAPQQVWGGPVPLTTPMVGGMMMQPASGTATSPTFNPFMA